MYRPMIYRPKSFGLQRTIKSRTERKKELLEYGDGPKPTQDQLNHFKEHRKAIVESKLFPQLKRTKDTLHGAQSRNIQIKKKIGKEEAEKRELIAQTYDYDVWSRFPKKRAIEIENKLDKHFKADIAQVEKAPVGKKAPDYKSSKRRVERYTVVTPVTPAGKNEVDFTTLPIRPFKTNSIDGIKHETLKSSYKRAQEDKDIPIRTTRAYAEIRNTEKVDRLLKSRRKRGVL